jgi:hypothetical protein
MGLGVEVGADGGLQRGFGWFLWQFRSLHILKENKTVKLRWDQLTKKKCRCFFLS